jgi:hypothetical protein
MERRHFFGAETILADLTSHAEGAYVSPYDLSLCAAGLEDWDTALDHLERAYQDRVMRVISIGDPEFDGLCGESRFMKLARRLRLPPWTFSRSGRASLMKHPSSRSV